MNQDRSVHKIAVRAQFNGRRFGGPGDDENRNNRRRMTGRMEVLQIQPIIPNLINRGAIKYGLADLELQNEHNRADQKHDINPPPHPGDTEFQKD